MIKKAVEYIRIPKKPFYTVVALTVVLVMIWVFWPTSVPIDIGEITIGELKQMVVDEGFTHFSERHVISAPADGITPNLQLEVGDLVKKGQVLIEFFWDANFKIKSPVNGYVLNVFEKDRRHIMRGTPILEVGNPESMEVHSLLLSEEVVGVEIGQKALITNWGKNQPLEAQVSRIEPAAKEEISALGVKEKRVKVHLELLSPKEVWQGLGDGYRVEVNIILKELNRVKRLPVGALFSKNGMPAIYIFKNKRVHLTPVELGIQNREFAELKSDIAEGTKVVLYPGATLEDQQKAIIRKK